VKAVVTGGGGFLGRALVSGLLAKGHEVVALGRCDYPELAVLGARTVRADVLDRAALREAFSGQDVVFHAAAKAGVWGPRETYLSTNVRGTENVVAACRAALVRGLVYTSSPSVVFDGRDHEGASNDLPYPPRYQAAYPETKAAAERLVLAANDPDLATVALRPHLIWGPRDPHLLPRLIARAEQGRLRIVGDGRNQVSVTYVENAAEAHLRAAERLHPGAPCAGRAYFVNDAEPVALWPWLNALLERLGVPRVTRRVLFFVARGLGAAAEGLWTLFRLNGEPPMTRFVAAQLASTHWYDLGPARRDLGYEPTVGPVEALDRTVAWWTSARALASAGRS
jgi:2-alkyl-3-oxoalkanoate reductase